MAKGVAGVGGIGSCCGTLTQSLAAGPYRWFEGEGRSSHKLEQRTYLTVFEGIEVSRAVGVVVGHCKGIWVSLLLITCGTKFVACFLVVVDQRKDSRMEDEAVKSRDSVITTGEDGQKQTTRLKGQEAGG